MGDLGGRGAAAVPLGSPLRVVASTAPVALPDGRLAVAWADDDGVGGVGTGAGRVHLAIAGARNHVAPPAPAVRAVHLPRQRRYLDQPLRLPLVCSRACDVSAAGVARSRPTAGRLTLRLFPRRRRPGPAAFPVTVHAGGPGGRRTTTLRVRVPELIRRPPPVPTPLDVTARRRSRHVVVAWRVAFPGCHVDYIVIVGRRRSGGVVATTLVHGGRAGLFHGVVRGAAGARYVTVLATSAAGGRDRSATVRVTR